MPDGVAVQVSFDGVSAAEAGRLAQDLRAWLREADPTLSVERRRTDPSAMDLGGALQVMSMAADAVALAQLGLAIVGWLRSRRGRAVTVSASDGGAIAEGVTALDGDRLTDALRRLADG